MKEFDSQKERHWSGCPIEEAYFGENRKAGKEERKRIKAKDRSKYKKTDLNKAQKKSESPALTDLKEGEREGRVLSIMPQGIVVDSSGERIICSLKGALKKEKTQLKNLVAVGDIVCFEMRAGNEGVIFHVQPRTTILSRADNLSRRKEQLIAVNIDQVIIVASVVNPPLKPSVIDRYIIATEKGGMRPLIVVNKIDLLDSETYDASLREAERECLAELISAYKAIDVPLITVSVSEKKGIDELKEAMRGSTSVFSGQSGVGKSSLINATTGLNLATGETVAKTGKGAHTTTRAELIPLAGGGWCIDTPGIKSFGLWKLDESEVEDYFDEIHALGLHCKFSDCTHTCEESCNVQKALEEGALSPLRYISYLALQDSVRESHVRR